MDAPTTPPAKSEPPALPKSLWRRVLNFGREIWNDHDFWIRALAIKGGASAAALAGLVGISYAVSLPFVLAAAAVSACTGLIGLGLYGVFLGGLGAGDKLGELYAKTISGKTYRQKPPLLKRLHQKLVGSPRVQKWMAKPVVQKFLESRPWKFTRALAQREQDVFMAGLAGTGSIFWGTVSAVALAAVLPALAIGSVFTFGTALAAAGAVSGGYGLYLSVQSMVHSIRSRRKKREEEEAQPAPGPSSETPPVLKEKLASGFNRAAEKEAPKQDQATKPSPNSPPPTP